jgi:zinc protease
MRLPFAARPGLLAAGLCFCLGLWLPAGPAAAAGVFNPTAFELPNGLQVVVIPDHRAPVVTQMVWYKVGAADEGPGESGVAHFLEHLMFKGTERLAPGEFSRIVGRNGGRDNAFTSLDYTGYYQNLARDKLDLVMGMEADRMVNLKLDERSVETEREVVLEERRQRTDNDPASQLYEVMQATQYLSHPYGIPVIGWEHEIRGLNRAAAIAFYRRHYRPNNAILIVAGDVTVDEVKALAEKHFGPLPRGPETPRVRPQEPPQLAARRVVFEDARVRQPGLQRSYLAPRRDSANPLPTVALDLFAEILGGGSVSRLYQELVVKRGLAASASAHYSGISLDPTTFAISLTPVPGGDLAALEAALDETLAKVLADGITAAELERARNSSLASVIYARDNLGTGPRVLGTALASGFGIDDIEGWPDELAKVGAEDVMAAARQVLDKRRSVTGVLLPKGAS